MGVSYTIVESVGTKLQYDASGFLYADDQPIYQSTRHLKFTTFAGYEPVAIEDFGNSGGKQLVFRTSTGLTVWQLDAGWKRSGALPGASLSDETETNSFENLFNVDFDQDGDIGS